MSNRARVLHVADRAALTLSLQLLLTSHVLDSHRSNDPFDQVSRDVRIMAEMIVDHLQQSNLQVVEGPDPETNAQQRS